MTVCACAQSGPAVYDLTPCHCPTRLLRPWDCPGKNTAVGCHSLLPGGLLNPCVKSMIVIYKLSVSGALFIYVKKSIKVKAAQTCLTLCNLMDYNPWNSPGQNARVDSLSLLRGIFPTQESDYLTVISSSPPLTEPAFSLAISTPR